MANVKGIEVSGTTYDVEDSTARTTATSAASTATSAEDTANTINTKVGNLDDLDTTDKSSIVNAINEVAAGASGGFVEVYFRATIEEGNPSTISATIILEKTGIDLRTVLNGAVIDVRFANKEADSGNVAPYRGSTYRKIDNAWSLLYGDIYSCYVAADGNYIEVSGAPGQDEAHLYGYIKIYEPSKVL